MASKKTSHCKKNEQAKKNFSLTAIVRLDPTRLQSGLILDTLREYATTFNGIMDYIVATDHMPKLSSATVKADLPSCLRCQVARDVKSNISKCYRQHIPYPEIVHPFATWNNQNLTVYRDAIAFPVVINGKCTKIKVAASMTDDIFHTLDTHHIGSLRITRKNKKLLAQISYTPIPASTDATGVMGVDLGIKCPAVAVTSTGKTQFFGNGRERRYRRRRLHARRKQLQKKKNLKKVRKLGNKEQRWMRDQDHKLSRQIVAYAMANHIGTIKLEHLGGVRHSVKYNHKYNRELSNWSFYRLCAFITYKARLAGINVIYVDPAYTSQTCPCCGQRNHASDRNYVCACGYSTHRDRVGALNILHAPTEA